MVSNQTRRLIFGQIETFQCASWLIRKIHTIHNHIKGNENNVCNQNKPLKLLVPHSCFSVVLPVRPEWPYLLDLALDRLLTKAPILSNHDISVFYRVVLHCPMILGRPCRQFTSPVFVCDVLALSCQKPSYLQQISQQQLAWHMIKVTTEECRLQLKGGLFWYGHSPKVH